MTCNCNRDGDIEYTITLNAQGPQGPAGAEGQAGFSPVIGVYSDTEANYQLQIITADGEIVTPNLKGTINTNDFVTINGRENIVGTKTFLSPTYFNDGLFINYPAGGNFYTRLSTDSTSFKIAPAGGKDIIADSKLFARSTKSNADSLRPVLTDNNILAGEGINILKDGEGNVTINGITPDNLVTTNTSQNITGYKTFSGITEFWGTSYFNTQSYVSARLGAVTFGKILGTDCIKAGDGINITKGGTYDNELTISVTDTPSSNTSNNGIKGDYATNYGIIDCQNGLVTTSATSLDVEITGGLVMKLAGNPLKTTNGSTFTYTVQETDGVITLFYTEGGTIIEAGDVFYQTTEPTNGTMSFAAWYNPELESGKWQFKSNDTGNVWREASATPIVDLTIANGVITNTDYTGYRVLDDEIFALKNETIQTVTTPLKKEGNALSLNIDNQTIQVNTQGQLTANLDELGNEVNSLSGRVTALEGSIGNNSIQRLTATQYVGLTTKNPNTLYIVIADDNSNFTMYIGEIPLFMPSGRGGDNASQRTYLTNLRTDVTVNRVQQ